MGEQKNTVVINGKIYDAVTGRQVATHARKNSLVGNPVKETASLANPPKKSRQAHHIARRKPQRSRTLKRTVAQRPTAITKSTSLPFKNSLPVTAGAGGLLLSNGNRYERAKTISKSKAISRFNFSQPAAKHQPIPVTPAPQEAPAHHPPLPKAELKASQDLFSEALSNAHSHKQAPANITKRKHRVAKKLHMKPRTANAIAIIFVSLAVSGLALYYKAPSISMRFAASKSGLVAASLPSFQPSGFSLDRHVEASPGRVALYYHSNSDDRTFTVTQESSNWNSQTLADSFLVGKQSQKIEQPDGKTVYLYDDANVTWVDGGIWYRIEGNSSLSTDQLLKIASSF